MYIMYIVHRFFSQANDRIAIKLAHDGLQTPGKSASTVCSRSRSRSKVTWYGHFCTGTKIASWGLFGIRGIIHYSRQVCNLLFLALQYSSPGGSTTAGEVCYLRLPCCRYNRYVFYRGMFILLAYTIAVRNPHIFAMKFICTYSAVESF